MGVLACVLELTLAVVAAAGEDPAGARKGCEAGVAADCRQLGFAYLGGRGVKKSMAEAAAFLRKACDGGSAAGCSNLAVLYRAGRGFPKDEAAAAALSERGCEAGDPFGCMALSFSVAGADGKGTTRAAALMARSATLAQEACDAGRLLAEPEGDVSACSLLGSLYDEGWGVAKDAKRAVALFEKGCSAGDSTGCFFLGRNYLAGSGLPKDAARAAGLFERACGATRHPAACFSLAELGRSYLSGSGVSKDAARAAALLERACEGGITPVCAGVGEMYLSGTGVRKDAPRAVALLKRACDAGDCDRLGVAPLELACGGGVAAACSTLGLKNYLGSSVEGVPQDRARAAAFYARACDGGDPKGCFELADFHNYGLVEPGDGPGAAALVARGIGLSEEACNGGNDDMCRALGRMYRDGSGVPQDPGRAAAFFKQACDGGSVMACEDLQRPPK